MSHVRQQIREEVAALLTPALAPVQVYVSRVYAVQRDMGVIIYTSLEEAATDIIRPKDSTLADSNRFCTVTIEIYSKGPPTVFDAQIDQACIRIEKALFNDGSTFLYCKGWEYRGLSIEYSSEGEHEAGVATLEYAFQYRTSASDPETGE
jgi:hypothetical protein